MNHLLRSATRVIRHYQVDDVDVVIATLLHDAVEDHAEEIAGDRPGDPTEAALAVIAERFGPRVADLVRAVTNPEYDDDRDHHVQYREHVADSLEDNPWARVVKVSDFTDNGVGLIHTMPGPKLHKLANKYRPLVPILRDMVEPPGHAALRRGQAAHLRAARRGRGALRRHPRPASPLVTRRLTQFHRRSWNSR